MDLQYNKLVARNGASINGYLLNQEHREINSSARSNPSYSGTYSEALFNSYQ